MGAEGRGRKHTKDTACGSDYMLDLTEKDFKTAIINMFKGNHNENERSKERYGWQCCNQIENINRHRNYIH